LPMTSMTHHYFVTEPVAEFRELETELPVIRDDREVSGYIRMEQKAGLIGIYEKARPNSVWEDHCPWELENHLFDPDYDRVMPWLENALQRVPVLANYGIKREVHGAISHPPDGNPLIGPVTGLRNYWACCGCQIGIGWGPGLTRELARWMVHGAADISMREFDPRRFGSYAVKNWQVLKAKEDYCLRHEIPFPHFNRLAGRPQIAGALYETLQNKGAVHEEVHGFERPRWFARGDIEQRDYYSFRRNELHEVIAAEVNAVASGAGIQDITAFAKVMVSGSDAASFLDGLVANNIPQRDGSIILTHFLNESGRIELEATIVRLDEQCFYIVCAVFFVQRLLDHLNAHRQPHQRVLIEDYSKAWGAMALQGPAAQSVLSQCTSTSLALDDFRWLSAQRIGFDNVPASAPIWALRLSYAGESGWEIHCPAEHMLAVYQSLTEAGQPHGIADYGSFAMNSMRMEKGFKGAGELTNEVTLPEADVMRFVKLDKEFVGRSATRLSLENPLRYQCAYLEIDGDGVFDGHGGEAVFCDGKTVGSTSSVAWGHRVNKLLAFAYVKPQAAQPGTRLQVMVMGRKRDAAVLAEAAYDPANRLPRSL